MKTALFNQMQNPALEQREMVLIKSASEVSLERMGPGPVKDLLMVDLALIAAMQQSLKDTKYAKHIEHKSPNFDAKKMMEELGEQRSQIKYWTSKLEDQGQARTEEMSTAVALNLARVARAFGKLNARLSLT